jgi:putative restriction endonuclease
MVRTSLGFRASATVNTMVVQGGLGGVQQHEPARSGRLMHVLLKWNPKIEPDALNLHREVAGKMGHSWWGCDSASKTAAPKRIRDLNAQINRGETVWAFLYRVGDDPRMAMVWRAVVSQVTDRRDGVDETFRPSGYTLDGSFLWLKLSEFTQLKAGWVLQNLEKFDQKLPVDRGALSNQTSPMYVSIRAETDSSRSSIVDSESHADPSRMGRYFGELPGFPIGSTWQSRLDVAHSGVHKPSVGGISGTAAEGADSIVVNGGYEDDEDYGDEILCTGGGGNDPATGKQIADQRISQPGNAGLITSELGGLPVRVVRGPKGDPRYSPETGFRYDGLYRVDEHWSQIGRSGYRVWRFKLVRLSDQESAPYIPNVNLPPGNPNPATSVGVATRIIRSTLVSNIVKKLYGNRCQVCDCRLDIPGGRIAEGAHIRALGKPHSGPDVPENILCLCPNHHSVFDAGGIYWRDDHTVVDYLGNDIGCLTVHPQHEISESSIRYHREIWGY